MGLLQDASTSEEHGEPGSFRAGFVAIVGLPNVGKSTLLNRLVGEKLSIVTWKAQTTRQRLLGIFSDEGHQAVYIDTPGLLEPRYLLQESMLQEAHCAVGDADVLVYVVDAGFEPSVVHAQEYAPPIDIPAILCLNKIDRREDGGTGLLADLRDSGRWASALPTVAVSAQGIAELKQQILQRLPFSPPYYPTDEIATAPIRFLAAELVRETCLEMLSQEVPYSMAVGIEEFRDSTPKRCVYAAAVLYVERESQKGIVIGAHGKTIRELGTRSRKKIELLMQEPVYLDLRVKVLPNWRKQRGKLKLLGYTLTAAER